MVKEVRNSNNHLKDTIVIYVCYNLNLIRTKNYTFIQINKEADKNKALSIDILTGVHKTCASM